MKLTFILGNGFDLALGLKTKYKDFYEAFLTACSSSLDLFTGEPIIKHTKLVEMINDKRDIQDWADLELLLASHIGDFDSLEELSKEKSVLEKALNDYLRAEQNRLKINNDYYMDIKEKLDQTVISLLNVFNWSTNNTDDSIEVQFLTFNYTDVIDRIVNTVNGKGLGGIKYAPPLHIHGGIDEYLLLGVDSKKQYDKLALQRYSANSIKLNRIMCKPLMNLATRPEYVNRLYDAINSAEKILIYGSSIGDTDYTWWKKIAQWLLNDKSMHRLGILVFVDPSIIVSATAQMILSDTKEKYERLIDNADLGLPKLHKCMIETRACGDKVFSFSYPGIEIMPDRYFPGLTLNV